MTDWKTLWAELIRVLELAEAALADIGDADREPGDDLAWAEARAAQDLPRIRAALAQPEPEGPTEHDIAELAEDIEWKQLPQDEATRPSFLLEFALAVLARWDRRAIEPVPVAERPWEREGWCDAEGRCWLHRPAEIPCRLANGTLYRWVLDTPCWDEEGPLHDTHSLPHHALPLPTP